MKDHHSKTKRPQLVVVRVSTILVLLMSQFSSAGVVSGQEAPGQDDHLTFLPLIAGNASVEPASGGAQGVLSGYADVSITKGDDPDPVMAGQNLTYGLNVTNHSSNTIAREVVAYDGLDPNTTFVWGAWAGGSCTEAAGIVTCEIGALNPGQTATITIVVIVSPSAPAGGAVQAGECTVGQAGVDLCNQAAVLTGIQDPNTANNYDSEPTDVIPLKPTSTPTKVPKETPTSTPTNTPTNTPTGAPTATATSTPTNTPTGAPTATATSTPTNTPTGAPTATATSTPTNTPTGAPTATATSTPTSTPTGAPTATATNTPTNTPTGAPTATATSTPTNTPTGAPTATATSTPTNTPTGAPTATATSTPTSTPTGIPTATNTPTATPTSTLVPGAGSITLTKIVTQTDEVEWAFVFRLNGGEPRIVTHTSRTAVWNNLIPGLTYVISEDEQNAPWAEGDFACTVNGEPVGNPTPNSTITLTVSPGADILCTKNNTDLSGTDLEPVDEPPGGARLYLPAIVRK